MTECSPAALPVDPVAGTSVSRSPTGPVWVLPDADAVAASPTLQLAGAPAIPDYLRRHYSWAYLNPRNLLLLDRPLIVSSILWGNYHRLCRAVLDELHPGQSVLQAACVYGDLSPSLAGHLGEQGRLDVIDVAPLQIDNCRAKLDGHNNANVRLADASAPGGGPYDAVCCFFLLHEIPDAHKRRVVDGLLASLAPDGKAVFVDYHRPHPAHPLKWPMRGVFGAAEPFATSLWRHEIADFAGAAASWTWTKQTWFGGLYQKVVVSRG